MPIPHEALLAYWHAALAAEIGIAIPVSDRRGFAKEMWQARQESGQAKLMELTIQQPAKTNEVWICHKSVEIPEEEDEPKAT